MQVKTIWGPMKKAWWLLFLVSQLLTRAWAFEPFKVEDIRVEGLQRISAGTVFNYLPVKVGDTLTQASASTAIRDLFQTGFFRDVRLERQGGVLIVSVTERPAIANIKISGNHDIETDKLKDALKEIGLAEGRVFDRSMLDKVEQELRRQYFSRGKYGVRITSTVTPLERNRVGVAIDISEGRVARILDINIVGNRRFGDKELLKTFQLTGPTLFSFYTGSNQYSREKLAADLESLRSFYLDRGYINFNIDSTQVSITPDKRDIYITINVTEGEQFTVDQVKLAGNLVVAPEQLYPLVSVHEGEVFSRKEATATATRIGERLGNEGYAFANVNTVPDIKPKTKQVTLTFFVDPGKRVYVRRINFIGNARTRDEVLRREMRQLEGAWFSTAAVNRSRERLQRLGYFEDVTVETPAVPGTTDQVDVNYTVTERLSGSVQVGVGYSQSQGVLFNTALTQDNFLGSGNRVSFAFNNSTVNQIYSFSYLNPYWTLDGVSRGFSAYFRTTDASQANLSNYTTDVYGGNVNFGIPINEFDTIRMQAGYEHTRINTTSFSPLEVTDFIAANGDTFDTIKLNGSWSHDTRNRAIFPDRGGLQTVSAEVSVPGASLDYYKLSYRQLRYLPLTRALTLSLNGEVAYGDGYGDTDALPFFENFYAGGVRSVRGFKDNTLGPRDSNGNPLGGSFRVVGNAELLFPAPFQKESKSLRLSAFYDIGNVFDNASFNVGDLRYSVGLSAIWLSPVGPLAFSVAKPLNAQSGDETQAFQFTLGTQF